MRATQRTPAFQQRNLGPSQEFEGTIYRVGQAVPPYGTILAFYPSRQGTMVRLIDRNVQLSILHKFKEGAK
jgi:hypothetical protein